jgi:hypothetical protein
MCQGKSTANRITGGRGERDGLHGRAPGFLSRVGRALESGYEHGNFRESAENLGASLAGDGGCLGGLRIALGKLDDALVHEIRLIPNNGDFAVRREFAEYFRPPVEIIEGLQRRSHGNT